MVLPTLLNNTQKSFLFTLSLIIFLYISSFLLVTVTFAADAVFFDVPPPDDAQRLPASECQLPEECSNTAVPGQSNQCGSACPADDSGNSGSSWTKYRLTCVADTFETTSGYYNKENIVYSTADKCSDGSNNPPFEQYLRSGQCDGNIGGIYKTCCSNDGGISSNSCVPITPSSGAPTPPMDGVCPGGSYWVMCGVDQATCNRINAEYGPGRCTTDACGSAVCGSTGEPPPPPPETPPPVTPTPEPVCVALLGFHSLCHLQGRRQRLL